MHNSASADLRIRLSPLEEWSHPCIERAEMKYMMPRASTQDEAIGMNGEKIPSTPINRTIAESQITYFCRALRCHSRALEVLKGLGHWVLLPCYAPWLKMNHGRTIGILFAIAAAFIAAYCVGVKTEVSFASMIIA